MGALPSRISGVSNIRADLKVGPYIAMLELLADSQLASVETNIFPSEACGFAEPQTARQREALVHEFFGLRAPETGYSLDLVGGTQPTTRLRG